MQIGRFSRVAAVVIAAGLIGVLNATPVAADNVRDGQWPLQRYGAEQYVWTQTQGEGITVAVIDSGVNAQQLDLIGQVLPGRDFSGVGGDGRRDEDGHGTGMASLIAGHGHDVGDGVMGLAPKVKILPVRITLKESDSSVPELIPSGEENKLDDAIRYSVDQGADVINMSIGGYISSAEEREAIHYAVENDVVVVAAAGNDNEALVGYPAAYPGVVAVGAVDVNGKIWPKSNRGPEITITAPGEQIIHAGLDNATYTRGSGTSPATAYVSAAAALVRAKFPDLSAGQVINRLMKSAMAPPDGTKVPSEKYGAGILNPNQALTKDIPLGPKENPLLARASADDKESSAPPTAAPGKSDTDKAATAAEKPAEDDGSPIVLIVAGTGALIVIITAVAIVMTRRRPAY